MKHILIIGNYGAGNLGDDAIFAGICTELKELGFKGKIMVTHGGHPSSPEIYQDVEKVPFAAFGLRSRMNRKRRAAVKSAFSKADLAILGGGGLFVDSESRWAPYIWAKQAKRLRQCGTDYICYGQSVGPLNKRTSRLLVKQCFSHAKAVHVRDQASADSLESLGIQECHVGMDPAFSWLLHQNTPQRGKNQLLVSLREWGSFNKSNWPSIVKALKSHAKKNKLKLAFISMDPGNRTEAEALMELGEELLLPQSSQEAYQAIASAKMVLAMRLHASIFRLSAKKPLLALSYSDKVENLFNTLDPHGAVACTSDLSAKTLPKMLRVITKESKPRFNLEKHLIENHAFLAHAIK